MRENPFMASFSRIPKLYIGRQKEINEYLETLGYINSKSHTTLITGVRGSGKTTLLTNISQRLKTDDTWIVIEIPNIETARERIISVLEQELKSFLDKLSVAVQVLGVSISNEPTPDEVTKMQQLLALAEYKNKKVIYIIDELQESNDLKQFITIHELLLRQNLPSNLLAAGLPENVIATTDNNYLTFAKRANKIKLRNIDLELVTDVYMRILGLNKRVATLAAKLTKGHGFAIQLLGEIMYSNNVQTIDDLKEVLDEYREELNEQVYSIIASKLPPRELEFLKQLGNEPMPIKTVSEQLGWDSNKTNQYRIKLIERGLIRPTSRGVVEILLPEFKKSLDYEISF